MPNLPQRKVGIVACSGEELPEGTVTRLAALKVLEELRPAQTVTICLPLFLAGGEGRSRLRQVLPHHRGGRLREALRGAGDRAVQQQAGGQPPGRRDSGPARPAAAPGRAPPTPESHAGVDALAADIAAEVDHLIAVRWSRTEGAILEGRRAARRPSAPAPAPAARASPSPPW